MTRGNTQHRWRMATVGGIAAILEAAILLVGIAGLVMDVGALRPWLAVLFGINAGVADLSLASLEAVNLIDVAVLGLTGLAFAGFWPGPGKPHKAWTALTVLLPFAGIAVLLATQLWGRSGLMGGGLVLSIMMLGSREHRRARHRRARNQHAASGGGLRDYRSSVHADGRSRRCRVPAAAGLASMDRRWTSDLKR